MRDCVRSVLNGAWLLMGFLGQGVQTGAITTLGRGGSDLTATVPGAAMELREVHVGG